MSSNSWTCEIESVADAARLFKAGILDWHNLAPKIAPQLHTWRSLTLSTMKNLNARQLYLKVVGSGSKLESASSQIKFEWKDNGGCVCQVVATYKLLPEVELKDESEAAKQSFVGIIKAAEAYLIANLDAYN